MEKMQYLLSLFIYALKRNSKISINTLFRYAYIYSASCDYLDNSEEKENEVIIDKNIGIADYSILFEAIQRLNESEMITMTDSANIIGTDKIYIFVENLLKQERVKNDLNRITYFVGVISNYSEDVVLSIFYNEPNVVEATNRNESIVNLKNNKLYELLTEFEKIAMRNVVKTWTGMMFLQRG